MRISPAAIWNCILINLEDLAVDPLLVTSMWSVIFDPHLLFDLIFYLSGRSVIRSQNKIKNAIFRAIWSDMPRLWKTDI
jgi:hypothetical protein